MTVSEKTLDLALGRRLALPDFRRWFLSKTMFGDADSTIWLCRSDHPWGSFPLQTTDDLGEVRVSAHQGETDVLLIIELDGGRRVALHIENKLAEGSFTHLQPEKYAARAKHWAGTAKYGNYVEWETVLVAPTAFLERFAQEAAKFDQRISHEDIARHAWEFA